MPSYEYNFDGLVGPTHNYAGLSVGNVASLKNAAKSSNPKQAALQGLQKMKALADMGLQQAVLPPLERPDIGTLKRLGFSGSEQRILENVYRTAPNLLVAVSSASSMWTANACTTSPSADTQDGRVHFTAANLANKFHRSIEATSTATILEAIFKDQQYFSHHRPLPTGDHFGDEGAANHTRFCDSFGQPGVEFFVFGKHAFDGTKTAPTKFPARQTKEASQAIARLHQLNPDKTVFAQQNPDVIDQGVFHNDVIAVGNGNTLFYHEHAFMDSRDVIDSLQKAMGSRQLHFVEVPDQKVSVQDAVTTYLFNSQLVTMPDGTMALIAPGECRENSAVNKYLDWLVNADNPINDVKIFDVKQSMQNGGGPACLRQRVVLSQAERDSIDANVFINDELYQQLVSWVEKHYRDSVSEQDLADIHLLNESRTALDELTSILKIGAVYPFQQV